MLSVVVPAYNEEQVLQMFVNRLRPILDSLDHPYEVVVVDDGSIDLTPAILLGLSRSWAELRVVRLRMNCGHQAALSAGLALARGDYIVSIDSDLQDPPELIPEMLAMAMREQLDVVYGVRSDRSSDGWAKRTTALSFYRITHWLTRGQAMRDAGDFRLMSRPVVDAVNSLPESGRVLRFVVPALGFPHGSVSYVRDRRAAGHTKYGVWHMVQLSLDSITGVSTAPLRLASFTGIAGAVVALAVGLTTVVAHTLGNTLTGWTSTVAIVAAFSAMQLLCLGILGEYLGRTHQYLQNRPTYYVASDSLFEELAAREGPDDAPVFSATQTTEEPNGRSHRPSS